MHLRPSVGGRCVLPSVCWSKNSIFIKKAKRLTRPKSESVTDRRTDGPTDQPTDGRTDGRTDKASYRDARTHLKTKDFVRA